MAVAVDVAVVVAVAGVVVVAYRDTSVPSAVVMPRPRSVLRTLHMRCGLGWTDERSRCAAIGLRGLRVGPWQGLRVGPWQGPGLLLMRPSSLDWYDKMTSSRVRRDRGTGDGKVALCGLRKGWASTSPMEAGRSCRHVRLSVAVRAGGDGC